MASVVRCGCQLGRGGCIRIPAQGGGGGVSVLEGGVRMPRVPARAWRSVTANGPELAPERRGGWGSVRCRSAGNVASTSVSVGSVSVSVSPVSGSVGSVSVSVDSVSLGLTSVSVSVDSVTLSIISVSVSAAPVSVSVDSVSVSVGSVSLGTTSVSVSAAPVSVSVVTGEQQQ